MAQRCGKSSNGKYEVRAYRASNDASGLGCDGGVESEEIVARRNVKLPADPDEREPLAHQEAIAKLRVIARGGRAARVVEERDQRFAAAIWNLHQRRPIASIRLFWSKDI